MSLILVTGATGFVGPALIEKLVASGHQVRAALRRPSTMMAENIVVGEIGPETDWQAALDGVDAVIHLAGRAHIVREASKNSLAAFRRVNAEGTARLAAAAESAGVRRFILMSSIKAAADTTSGAPLKESDPPHPRTPYGISKLEAERALISAARRMETVILRPPLIYGSGVKANFRELLRLIDSNLPLPFGSVRNRRSLIARDNLVDAVLTSLSAPRVAGGTFYLTDGPPLSTPDLIRTLADGLGRPARLVRYPVWLMKAGATSAGRRDTVQSVIGSLEADDSAFRAATGWHPPILQKAALRAVAAWYRASTHSGT